MDFAPLLNSNWLIVVHAFSAMAAVFIGAMQLLFKKGTSNHRQFGYVWVTLIVIVSLSSFGIYSIRLLGPFSPIHVLSVLTIYTAISAVLAVRAGQVDQHRKLMHRLYVLALIITGAFTFLPGRLMHQVAFGA